MTNIPDKDEVGSSNLPEPIPQNNGKCGGNLGVIDNVPDSGVGAKPPPEYLTLPESGVRTGVVATDSWLYAVRAKGDKSAPVKFGITTNIDRRMIALQTGHPLPLAKLLVIPGGRELEQAIHYLLAPWRVQGEWFEDEQGRLTDFAAILKQPWQVAACLQLSQLTPEFYGFHLDRYGLTPKSALDVFADRMKGPQWFTAHIQRCAEAWAKIPLPAPASAKAVAQ